MSPCPVKNKVLLLGSAQERRLGGSSAGRERTSARKEVGPAARRSPADAAASPAPSLAPLTGGSGDGANDDDEGVRTPPDIVDEQDAEEVGAVVELQGLLKAIRVVQPRARGLAASSLRGAGWGAYGGVFWARDASRRGGSALCPSVRRTVRVCTRQSSLASRTSEGIAVNVRRPSRASRPRRVAAGLPPGRPRRVRLRSALGNSKALQTYHQSPNHRPRSLSSGGICAGGRVTAGVDVRWDEVSYFFHEASSEV